MVKGRRGSVAFARVLQGNASFNAIVFEIRLRVCFLIAAACY